MQNTLITKEMQAAVGRVYRRATSFPISASDIRHWAVAVYYPSLPPRLYWDEEYAKNTRWGGIVAPEEFNPFTWMRASPQFGTAYPDLWPEPHLGIEPPATRANIVVELGATHSGIRMRPGDTIHSELSLQDYRERTGRLGLMLFTRTEDRLFNQNGDLVRTYFQTFIRYGAPDERLYAWYAQKNA